jgi:hypothetical protein
MEGRQLVMVLGPKKVAVVAKKKAEPAAKTEPVVKTEPAAK